MSLDGNNTFNDKLVSKIVKSLTAMVNKSATSVGYVCVGIPDNDDDFDRIRTLFEVSPFIFRNFKITGINHEMDVLGMAIDQYFKKILDYIQLEPIHDDYKDIICKNARIIQYHEKDILILKIYSTGTPAIYGDKYYKRHGSHIQEIPPENYPQFFVAYQNNGEQSH